MKVLAKSWYKRVAFKSVTAFIRKQIWLKHDLVNASQTYILKVALWVVECNANKEHSSKKPHWKLKFFWSLIVKYPIWTCNSSTFTHTKTRICLTLWTSFVKDYSRNLYVKGIKGFEGTFTTLFSFFYLWRETPRVRSHRQGIPEPGLQRFHFAVVKLWCYMNFLRAGPSGKACVGSPTAKEKKI